MEIQSGAPDGVYLDLEKGYQSGGEIDYVLLDRERRFFVKSRHYFTGSEWHTTVRDEFEPFSFAPYASISSPTFLEGARGAEGYMKKVVDKEERAASLVSATDEEQKKAVLWWVGEQKRREGIRQSWEVQKVKDAHRQEIRAVQQRCLTALETCPACGGDLSPQSDEDSVRFDGYSEGGTTYWRKDCSECERTILVEADPNEDRW